MQLFSTLGRLMVILVNGPSFDSRVTPHGSTAVRQTDLEVDCVKIMHDREQQTNNISSREYTKLIKWYAVCIMRCVPFIVWYLVKISNKSNGRNDNIWKPPNILMGISLYSNFKTHRIRIPCHRRVSACWTNPRRCSIWGNWTLVYPKCRPWKHEISYLIWKHGKLIITLMYFSLERNDTHQKHISTHVYWSMSIDLWYTFSVYNTCMCVHAT